MRALFCLLALVLSGVATRAQDGAPAVGAAPASLDAMIAAGWSSNPALPADSFVGRGVVDSTGKTQSVTSTGEVGWPTAFTVSLRKGASSDDVVIKAAEMPEGWSASYFFGPTDITTQVEGTGWLDSLEAGEEAQLRVEITPPTDAAIGDSRELLISAHALTTARTDAVKAIVRVQEGAQPDIAIKIPQDKEYLGQQVINLTGEDQTRSVEAAFDGHQIFQLRVRNTGKVAAAFKITGVSSTEGWTARYLDALEGGKDVTTQVSGAGWRTPLIEPDATLTMGMEISPTKVQNGEQGFSVIASSAHTRDVVVAKCFLPQFIGTVLYHYEHDDPWMPLPASGVIPVSNATTVGFLAVKGRKDQPWPRLTDPQWPHFSNYLPEWKDVSRDRKHKGTDYVVMFYTEPECLGKTNIVTVKCGNEKTIKVQVYKSRTLELDIWTDNKAIPIIIPETSGSIAEVVALVSDIFGNPQPGLQVHFALTGVEGQINDEGTEDDVAISDAQGYAKVMLRPGTTSGKALVTASVYMGEETKSQPATVTFFTPH